MRKVFAGLAILLMLVVVVQFYLAASGAFSTAPNDESFRPHRALGYVIFILPVLMTIVGALGRLPGRLIGMAGLIAGLTVVQMVIAQIAKAFGDTDDSTTAGQLVFGLHAINGLAILAVVGMIVRTARTLSKIPVPQRPVNAGGHAATRPAPGSVRPTP